MRVDRGVVVGSVSRVAREEILRPQGVLRGDRRGRRHQAQAAVTTVGAAVLFFVVNANLNA